MTTQAKSSASGNYRKLDKTARKWIITHCIADLVFRLKAGR
ncbi:MAG: hypothetical protein Q8O57_11005 [Kiritimatiellota bacterium]|nr:hypothetical protein [Kiritimatiellota bacterium]